jgi:hypothetical protein
MRPEQPEFYLYCQGVMVGHNKVSRESAMALAALKAKELGERVLVKSLTHIGEAAPVLPSGAD